MPIDGVVAVTRISGRDLSALLRLMVNDHILPNPAGIGYPPAMSPIVPTPKLTSAALEALTNTRYSRGFPMMGISEDGALLRFPGSLARPRDIEVLPESRNLALRLRELLSNLCYDGVDLSGVTIDIDAGGEFVVTVGQGRSSKQWQPHGGSSTNSAPGLVINLRHAVALSLWNTSGQLDIHDVAFFLSEAVRHFKYHRDELKSDPYPGGSFETQLKTGRRVRGFVQLSRSGVHPLATAAWADAVIDAYTKANTVEQMLEDLPAIKQAASGSSAEFRELIGLLGDPGGDLLALATMFNR